MAPQPVNQVTISSTKIAALVCPSENFKAGPWIATNLANYRASFGGPGVIAGWSGAFVVMQPNVNGQSGCACITDQNVGSFGTEGVTDGTSNTAAISEKLIGTSGFGNSSGSSSLTAGNMQMAKRGMFLPPSGLAITIDSGGLAANQIALTFYQACNSIPGMQTMLTYSGWWCGAVWDGSHWGTLNFNAYNHWNTPNKFSCLASNSYGSVQNSPGSINDAITATSNHPGGVNVVFMDGSVHFVKDSVSPNIWWRWEAATLVRPSARIRTDDEPA